MGPGFGDHLVEGFIAICVMCLIIGAIVGLGCNAGCAYARSHINVEWKP